MKCKFENKYTLKNTLPKTLIIFKNNLGLYPYKTRSLKLLNKSYKSKLAIKYSLGSIDQPTISHWGHHCPILLNILTPLEF